MPTSLADALFTTTQQRLLALLYGQPLRSFFAGELIELTGSGSGAVQRELERLSSSGLVTVTRVGKQKHYTSPEYEARKAAGDGFLARVLAGEHVMLMAKDDGPPPAR